MEKSILIVDDSKTIRQQVRIALEPTGLKMIEAVDGKEGLDKIRSTIGLAVVICDINMPQMNGLEMLEAVRADGRFGSLPIVMLTTEGQPELIKRAKESGAKGWIVKPFKPDMLLAAVKKLAGVA